MRVMDNFNTDSLTLVAPQGIDLHVAARSACWAARKLESIQFAESLPEAVAAFTQVIGFSPRVGKNIPKSIYLNQIESILSPFVISASAESSTALLFGPEDTGLMNEDFLYCTDVVCIDTNPENPSMNLSHAVAVALYEIDRYRKSICNGDVSALKKTSDVSEIGEYDVLQNLVSQGMRQTGFFNENTPTELPGLIKQVMLRAKLTKREMQIFQGIFGSITRKSL